EACGDRPALRARQGRHRRCSGTPYPDYLPVCRHLHQGTTLLNLLGVSLQPQRSRWLVVAAGGYLPFVLSSCPVLNTAAMVVQTAGGCWLSCCPVLNTAAPVVQTAGGCWCILSLCIEAHLEAHV